VSRAMDVAQAIRGLGPALFGSGRPDVGSVGRRRRRSVPAIIRRQSATREASALTARWSPAHGTGLWRSAEMWSQEGGCRSSALGGAFLGITATGSEWRRFELAASYSVLGPTQPLYLGEMGTE